MCVYVYVYIYMCVYISHLVELVQYIINFTE